MDEQKNTNEKNDFDLKDCWIKFALLILALFLGSYLATYFIIDQTRHSYSRYSYMPDTTSLSKPDSRRIA